MNCSLAINVCQHWQLDTLFAEYRQILIAIDRPNIRVYHPCLTMEFCNYIVLCCQGRDSWQRVMASHPSGHSITHNYTSCLDSPCTSRSLTRIGASQQNDFDPPLAQFVGKVDFHHCSHNNIRSCAIWMWSTLREDAC